MDKFTKRWSLVGVFCGVGTIGTIILFQNKLSETLKKSKPYKEVMEEVRKHRGAIQFLGEPIEDKKCTFDHKPKKDSNETNVQVDVVGPKSKGIVFYTTKKLDEKTVNVECIHLQIGNKKSELLVIK